jgi:lipoic acid synthetase
VTSSQAAGDRFRLPGTLSKPTWLRTRIPAAGAATGVSFLVHALGLHTVCEQACCPNRGECWAHGTATFLILGDTCTRDCAFCAVKSGRPAGPPDPDEPRRVAEAVATMHLTHAVVTSVSRDDLRDGGAASFAGCLREIRLRAPACRVEVLIPDLRGDERSLTEVIEARPDVLNHNVETVPRLYSTVRPQASFERSLDVLKRSHTAGLVTKSGLMVGLGEDSQEIQDTLAGLRAAGVDMLTLGQYLRPSRAHLPVSRYYAPDEFAELGEHARRLGFRHVASGPLVRSSYHAEEQHSSFRAVTGKP